MYTYEQRMAAVKLYYKYCHSISAVRRELGYPSLEALLKWVKEYEQQGDLHREFKRREIFTPEEKEAAIRHYLEHGRCVTRTVRALGYPSRKTLSDWIDEAGIERKQHCFSKKSLVQWPKEIKEQAVVDLCSRDGSAREVAEEYGVERETLYHWKQQLLGKEYPTKMKKQHPAKGSSEGNKPQSIEEALDRLASVQAELQRAEETLKEAQARAEHFQQLASQAEMELAVYEKAAELLKKGKGIDLTELKNREKARVINALRTRFPLKAMLKLLNMAKSSYCYQVRSLARTDKYLALRRQVRELFEDSCQRYGYRRIHVALGRQGICASEKVIRRIMREEALRVPYRNKGRRRYSSYAGEISPEVENKVNRDFHAQQPNQVWLTDITEFSIPAGKVYLSPVVDCFDGLPVTWTIGTSPNAELVNTMLDEAIATLKDGEHPIVHSDRGCHYRWPGWIERMDSAGLTRSMSKKGCSPDNAACEGFFGRLKNEMFYHVSWRNCSVDTFIRKLDQYLHWYAEKRIKLSLGGLSPVEYRLANGYRVP